MSKPSVVIHPRFDDPKPDYRKMSVEEIIESAGADWDPQDPGVGRAVLLPDGREVFNPVPFAPPVGYTAEIDVMTRMHQMLRAELLRQKEADEVVETPEEMNDFPEDIEQPFHTFYELIMMDDLPSVPDLPDPGEPPPPKPPAPPVDGEEADPPEDPPLPPPKPGKAPKAPKEP